MSISATRVYLEKLLGNRLFRLLTEIYEGQSPRPTLGT